MAYYFFCLLFLVKRVWLTILKAKQLLKLLLFISSSYMHILVAKTLASKKRKRKEKLPLFTVNYFEVNLTIMYL